MESSETLKWKCKYSMALQCQWVFGFGHLTIILIIIYVKSKNSDIKQNAIWKLKFLSFFKQWPTSLDSWNISADEHPIKDCIQCIQDMHLYKHRKREYSESSVNKHCTASTDSQINNTKMAVGSFHINP